MSVTYYALGGGVFAPTEQPGADTVLLYVAKPASTDRSIELSKAFDSGVFCFVKELPTDYTGFGSFVRPLLVSGATRAFLWIDDPNARPLNPSRRIFLNSDGQILSWSESMSFDFRNATVTISADCKVCLNDAKDGLVIQPWENGQGLELVQGSGGAGELSVTLGAVDLLVDVDHQGMLQFDCALNEAQLDDLDVGLRYFWKDGDAFWSPRYPMFELAPAETVLLRGSLDPYQLTDPSRTYYAFTNGDGSFAPELGSYLRTLLGHQVTLTPATAPAWGHVAVRLRFTDKPAPAGDASTPSATGVYLAPEGDFVLGVAGAAATVEPNYGDNLLGGLSGTEYFAFTPRTQSDPAAGDVLRFVPDRRAQSTVEWKAGSQDGAGAVSGNGASSEAPDFTFTPLAEQGFTTSWVALLQASTDPGWYYSEPNGNPFFQHATDDPAPTLLDFLPVSEAKLSSPPVTAAPQPFPLVPYSHASVHDPPGSDADLALSAFEMQVLNPARKASVESEKRKDPEDTTATATATATADGYALTATGAMSRFHHGTWNQLRFAEFESQEEASTASAGANGESQQVLQFDSGGDTAALPATLRSAFLTNQLFLVVSVDQGNLTGLAHEVEMSGWAFKVRPPQQQVVGAYRNVWIFKSAKGKTRDLVANPSAWTERTSFTDTDTDPDGTYLKDWLQQYIKSADEAYKEGLGEASFQQFVELVDDPDWSGFLVLRVDLGLGELSEEIQALTAGIDMSRFYAHHMGNEVTHATPVSASGTAADGAPYKLSSAVFALVHYTDPEYERALSSGTQLPEIEILSTPYDFRVLSLIVQFEKAKLAGFSSKILLALGTLFGQKVLSSRPRDAGGSTSGADSADRPPATNRLILDGAIHTRNGKPYYSFSTASGSRATFYTAQGALASVEIDIAEFEIRSTTPVGNTKNDGNTQHDGNTTHFETAFALTGGIEFGHGPALGSPAGTDDKYFDLFSYLRLGFSNLAVEMAFDLDLETTTTENRTFTFDDHALLVKGGNIQIVDAHATSLQNGFTYVRKGGLAAQFPLKLKSYIHATSSTETPESKGYGAITVPPLDKAGMSGELGTEWYGLSYQFDIGTLGALSKNPVMTADMLLAWGISTGNWYVGLKFPGLGPIERLVDLEGVVKFGAQEVVMDLVTVDSGGKQQARSSKTVDLYVIKFASIGLSLLVFTFPAKGSTNVVVFGDPEEVADRPPDTLGWFGSYVQPDPAKQVTGGPQGGA